MEMESSHAEGECCESHGEHFLKIVYDRPLLGRYFRKLENKATLSSSSPSMATAAHLHDHVTTVSEMKLLDGMLQLYWQMLPDCAHYQDSNQDARCVTSFAHELVTEIYEKSLESFKQCQALVKLAVEEFNDQDHHTSIHEEKVFATELIASVYQTIASRFYDDADFGYDDDDDDSEDELDEDETREKYREFIDAAAFVGKSEKGWMDTLQTLSNADISNLSSGEMTLHRFIANVYRMEVLWVYSSYAYDKKEFPSSAVSLRTKDVYGLPVLEKKKKNDNKNKNGKQVQTKGGGKGKAKTSKGKGNVKNSVAITSSDPIKEDEEEEDDDDDELTPVALTLTTFRDFVEVFLQHMHGIREELTKQPEQANTTVNATKKAKKSSKRQLEQVPITALTLEAKCQGFFAHGRQEFYELFFHWINKYLEISILFQNIEIEEFKNHRMCFSDFPFPRDAVEWTVLLQKDVDIVLEMIQKFCLECVQIHRQLYDACSEKIQDLEDKDDPLLLELHAFNEKMNHEKVMIDSMIDSIIEKVKGELYGMIRKGYANPTMTALTASHEQHAESKYEKMKMRLFGSC
jgi:hypothetical protein